MKKMHTLYSIIGIFLIMLCACSQSQDAEDIRWQGRIGDKEGITEILNPEDPVYGSLELDLEEDLVLGRDDDDNTMFFNVNGLDVDDLGNIYILDAGNHRIQKFDRDGQFLQTIGSEGQGPGEFDRMHSFFLDEENNIYVAGNRKIHHFNSSGDFVKNINLTFYITDFCVAPDKSIFAVALVSDEEGRIRRILRLDSEGNGIEKIAEFAEVKTVQRKGKEGQVTSFAVSHSYNPELLLVPWRGGKFLYAFSANYRLFCIDAEGKPVLRISKDEDYLTISQKEKDKIVQSIRENISSRGQTWPEDVIEEACQFPEHRPFFYRLITDDKGRIYVRRLVSTLDESEAVEYDIFDPEGHYLYRAVLPFSPNIIKDGRLYDIMTDDESGDVKIKRYRIKNWDKIEKGI